MSWNRIESLKLQQGTLFRTISVQNDTVLVLLDAIEGTYYYDTRRVISVYYVADFITSVEANGLWEKVYEAPRPKWVTLKNRRLQNWGGIPYEKGMISEPLPHWLTTCVPRMQELGVFEGTAASGPNHVLVNEYKSGQGIMPHLDGPAYVPVVATITLGSYTVLDFYEKEPSIAQNQPRQPSFSLLLRPNSLLVLREEAYTCYLHGIAESTYDDMNVVRPLNDRSVWNYEIRDGRGGVEEVSDRGEGDEMKRTGQRWKRDTRISLTFRAVAKVRKSPVLLLRRR